MGNSAILGLWFIRHWAILILIFGGVMAKERFGL